MIYNSEKYDHYLQSKFLLGTDFKKTLNENRSKTFIYVLRI